MGPERSGKSTSGNGNSSSTAEEDSPKIFPGVNPEDWEEWLEQLELEMKEKNGISIAFALWSCKEGEEAIDDRSNSKDEVVEIAQKYYWRTLSKMSKNSRDYFLQEENIRRQMEHDRQELYNLI